MRTDLPHAADILIVEDDHALAMYCSEALAHAGYTSEIAENGLKGLQRLLQHGYRLVLTDLEMPSLHGWGLIARLRATASLAGLPVIAMTASRDREIVSKVISIGVQGFLLKPFEPNALLDKVAELLKKEETAEPPFATCGGCGTSWPASAAFFADGALEPESFTAVLRNPLEASIVFRHEGCGSTVTVGARSLLVRPTGSATAHPALHGHVPVEGADSTVILDILKQLLFWQ